MNRPPIDTGRPRKLRYGWFPWQWIPQLLCKHEWWFHEMKSRSGTPMLDMHRCRKCGVEIR